ncbi:ATP:cob(I)alamin adenosyltransferase [Paenibacillus darwinianus]|uniref:Corrinoid adenosyltransferase n=1 Tax=Paenibacillus darwinianus TaxID=1380763 RepID=A0A9W5W7Q4_9BACL|nr:cob(I)yrinic acid a,c-diamide adenosyltransferase [Paenibacillus darwinianus]EXX85918.1 ATP:cob(I)alamin adenosyltransferase [Paenibacillus darwinianus]EXX88173.1 ATP:cob(I)alamin adenosyltransferase [Paenibacillus darwinianus]EXX88771.1 ATP:cob(I)alamin adenosyltransferase [Paenibacillus darwinianus]
MRLYTRTGDAGQTSLKGGRVRKDDARVEAYGTIDELNSFIGQTAAVLIRSGKFDDMAAQLAEIQQELFDCGSDLAFANEPSVYKMGAEPAARLESEIDAYITQAPELARFILPGGSEAAALLHVCRTVCRRAERRCVTLAAEHNVNAHAVTYLNRLSDYFFAAARVANARLGVPDVEYVRSANVFRKPKSPKPQ